MPGHLCAGVFVHLSRRDTCSLPLAIQVGPQGLKDEAPQIVALGDVASLAFGNVVGPKMLGKNNRLRRWEKRPLFFFALPLGPACVFLPCDPVQNVKPLADHALHAGRHP